MKINFVQLMRFAALFRHITASRLSRFIKCMHYCTKRYPELVLLRLLYISVYLTHGLIVVIKGSLVGQSFADYPVTAVFLIHRSLRFHRILYDFSTQKQWNGKQLHAFC